MYPLTQVLDSVVRNLAEEDEDAQYWLGVDGGGTNTRALIFSAPLEPDLDLVHYLVGEGHAAAANFHRVGVESATQAVTTAIILACRQANITPHQITAGCIGLAGVSHPDNHRKMYEAIEDALPMLNFTLETDARIALAGATAGKPGIVIIAGTGSIAYGINKDGDVARAGGWGPTLGDEGSGTYIGRRALEAVMTAYDRRAHDETALTEKVCRFFNVSTPPELPAVIYNPDHNVLPQIAQLSKIVVETAQAGDATAIAILQDAARELARAIKAVIMQLEMQDEAFRIGYVGGVFGAGDLILQPLREEIAVVAPNAIVAPPLHKPAVGAAQMAMTNFLQSRDQLLIGQQLSHRDRLAPR
ncbi:MAG TPA: BadF/BadG/BcrA/BcrD ATPase family protein [Blastocatellia bacterium]|nr:BadF/BadG/BcrA/BcrD ATPase family protein [Blastocatellia bacterium]